MKNTFLLILAINIFFISSLSSQDVDLTLGKMVELKRSQLITGLLHKDDSGYYMGFDTPQTWKNFDKEVGLIKYNKDFKEVFFKSFSLDRKVESLGIKFLKDKFVWLHSKINNKDKLTEYYITEISLRGRVSKKRLIKKVKFKSKFTRPEAHWKISQDSTHLLFFVHNPGERKGVKYSVDLTIYNSDYDKVLSKNVKMEESQKRVKMFDFFITDVNEVLITAAIYKDDRSASLMQKVFSKDQLYDYYMIKVSDEKVSRFKLDVKEHFIRDIRVQHDKNSGSLACVAMVGDSRVGPIQGISYFKLNPKNGKIEYSKIRYFTDDEIKMFGKKNTSKDQRSKVKGLDETFWFRDIIFKDDGSFLIVAEEFYYTIYEDPGPLGLTEVKTTKFYNNHILIANVEVNGEITEIKLIPKKYSTNKNGLPEKELYEYATHYMFFSSLNTGEHIYYLYNDSERSIRRNILDPDKYDVLYNYKKSVAVIAHFNEDGELVRKELFNRNDTDGYLLMPKFSSQLSKDEMFVVLRKRSLLIDNKLRLGILRVN